MRLRYPIGIAVLSLGLAVFFAKPTPTRAAAADAVVTNRWSFDLTKATVIQGDDAERMYGLVFEVDAEGSPALSQCYDLPGRAPEYHESPDVGRIYRFEVKDAAGKTLGEGRHFDGIAVYAPEPEGACRKMIARTHAMGVRTPHYAGARTLVLTLERTVGDTEETR